MLTVVEALTLRQMEDVEEVVDSLEGLEAQEYLDKALVVVLEVP